MHHISNKYSRFLYTSDSPVLANLKQTLYCFKELILETPSIILNKQIKRILLHLCGLLKKEEEGWSS